MKTYLKVLNSTEVFIKGELLTPTELTKAINKYHEHLRVQTQEVHIKNEDIYYVGEIRFDIND